MYRYTLIIIALLHFPARTWTMIDPVYTHNMFNHMAINPGFSGSKDMVDLTLLYRNQWVGFGDDAPQTSLFTANTPFTLFGKTHGIGLHFLQDRAGFNTDIQVKLNYAYRMKLADGMLGIGANFGLINSELKPTFYVPASSPLMVEASSDKAIPTETDKKNALDVGLGVFYNTDKIYFGLSAIHLNKPTQDYGKPQMVYERIFYITSGYNYQLDNPLYELVPSFILQTEGSTVQFGLNTNIVYNNKIWGGLSYRPGESITAMLGTEFISGLKFGYAYDFVISRINLRTFSTHEVVVNYSFKLKKERLPQRYKSIRFL